MNIDRDLLQFYRYKGIIKENDIETIKRCLKSSRSTQ